MATLDGYYRYDGGAPITQGGVAVATPGESKYFDEWAALLYNKEAALMVEAIDTYGYFSLQPAPPATSDHLVLAGPTDPNPGTLLDKIEIVSGGSAAILDGGLPTERLGITVTGGSGSGTITNHYRNTAGSLVIPIDGDWTDMTYPTAVVTGGGVTKLAGDAEFEFNDPGTYIVVARSTVESGDAMMRKQIRVVLDTGGGYAQYDSPYFSSNESAFNDEHTTMLWLPIVVSATDTIKIQVKTDGGTTPGVLHADGNSLTIMRFDPASAGTDSTAIHDNGVGEINAITSKATPVAADVTVIEDSAAGFVKKKVALSALPISTATQTALDGKVGFTVATVATTDATVTTLATIAVPATTTLTIEGTVSARRTGGVAGAAEDAAGYHVLATYKNVAGTATLVGAGSITVVGEDQAGWDVTLSASAGNALIRVTGAADNLIDWKFTYSTNAVS